MKLRKVIFYQSVRLWDNREYHTVNDGENKISLELVDHLVHVKQDGLETIVVPTANLRMGIQLEVEKGADPVSATITENNTDTVTEILIPSDKAEVKKKGKKK